MTVQERTHQLKIKRTYGDKKTQELYNKLRIKREYAREDVALRLSIDEIDALLLGLQELGADAKKGYESLLSFQEANKKTTLIHKRETVQAYDGLRARALSGKYKDSVGYIYLVKDGKKPLRLIFPSGEEQVYHTNQVKVTEKDREKFEERMKQILSLSHTNR